MVFHFLDGKRKHPAMVASSHNRSFYRAKTWGIEKMGIWVHAPGPWKILRRSGHFGCLGGFWRLNNMNFSRALFWFWSLLRCASARRPPGQDNLTATVGTWLYLYTECMLWKNQLPLNTFLSWMLEVNENAICHWTVDRGPWNAWQKGWTSSSFTESSRNWGPQRTAVIASPWLSYMLAAWNPNFYTNLDSPLSLHSDPLPFVCMCVASSQNNRLHTTDRCKAGRPVAHCMGHTELGRTRRLAEISPALAPSCHSLSRSWLPLVLRLHELPSTSSLINHTPKAPTNPLMSSDIFARPAMKAEGLGSKALAHGIGL